MALYNASRLTLPAVTSAVRGSAQLSELLRPIVASFHCDARYRTWWNHIQRQRQDHDSDFLHLPSVALPEPASLLMRSFGHPAPLGMLAPLVAAGLLQRAAARPFPSAFSHASGIDIQEHEKHYEISTDCPGMAEGDVAVELSPDKATLTISGTRTTGRPRPATPSAAPSDGKPDNANAAPAAPAAPAAAAAAAGEAAARGGAGGGSGGVRSYSFRRSFLLPDDVDAEGVTARLDRGVLSVTLPRRRVPQPQPLRVPVHAAGSGAGAGAGK